MKPSTARLIDCFTSINVVAQIHFGQHRGWRTELAKALAARAAMFREDETSDHIALRRVVLNSLQCRASARLLMEEMAAQFA